MKSRGLGRQFRKGIFSRCARASALTAALLFGSLAGTAMAQDLDADDDGIEDTSEGFYGADPQKADTDGDGVPDGYEVYELGSSPALVDTDDDGLDDFLEAWVGTAPRNSDTDGDGATDGAEDSAGTDPLVADGGPAPGPNPGERADRDGDGLFDDDEQRIYGTDPAIVDSDSDGAGDGEEVYLGTDPTK